MTKKLLLSLGAASLSIAPVVAIVSCSSESVNSDIDKEFDNELNSEAVDYKGKAQIKASEVTVEKLKENSNKKDSPSTAPFTMRYEYRNLVADDAKGELKFEIRVYFKGKKPQQGGTEQDIEGYSNWKSATITGFKTA